MNKEMYYITLPDGKKVVLWFIGPHLKQVLDAYNIPYEIKKGDSNV